MDAFEALVDDARTRLWRAYVAARGVDGADEAVSEALAWACEHRELLLGMENPVGYLYRVGLSRSISRRRPPSLPAPADVAAPELEPRLVPALRGLSEHQRSAVWLVHACGWTYAEVAEALDIGRSTVGTHVTRALAALRREFEVVDHA